MNCFMPSKTFAALTDMVRYDYKQRYASALSVYEIEALVCNEIARRMLVPREQRLAAARKRNRAKARSLKAMCARTVPA